MTLNWLHCNVIDSCCLAQEPISLGYFLTVISIGYLQPQTSHHLEHKPISQGHYCAVIYCKPYWTLQSRTVNPTNLELLLMCSRPSLCGFPWVASLMFDWIDGLAPPSHYFQRSCFWKVCFQGTVYNYDLAMTFGYWGTQWHFKLHLNVLWVICRHLQLAFVIFLLLRFLRVFFYHAKRQ